MPTSTATVGGGGWQSASSPLSAAGAVDIGRAPSMQSRAQDPTAYEHTVAPDVHDILRRHGKPPPVGMV